VGVLAYADDLVLLAPTPHALRSILQRCEEYAKEYNVLVNADKSECTISRPGEVAYRANFVHNISFIISDNVTENDESWPHLGHIITNNGSDKLDIMSLGSNFIGQVNNVICWFNKLDCCTKTRLLKSYCSTFYGCELGYGI